MARRAKKVVQFLYPSGKAGVKTVGGGEFSLLKRRWPFNPSKSGLCLQFDTRSYNARVLRILLEAPYIHPTVSIVVRCRFSDTFTANCCIILVCFNSPLE